MESSLKEQKIQAMNNYKRAKFVYNFVLYSLTSIITCFFFSYPFWFPSMNHFLSYLPNNISFLLNAKCFFVVGNLIVIILVGESKLKRSSSSTSDIYDEYIARSRSSSHHKVVNSSEFNGPMKSLNIEERVYHEGKKKEVGVCKSSKPHDEEKRKGMRSIKSEVWGESKIVKREKTKGKKEEEIYKSSMNHEEKIMGMRSCKSEVWGESEISMKRENTKGKKEEEIYKSNSMNHEEKQKGMRSCKSEVWGEREINMKREKTKGKKEEEIYESTSMNHEEKKTGMRSCKSEVWGESEINVKREKTKGKKEEEIYKSTSMDHEEKKTGVRSCNSEVWGESEINMKREKTEGKQEEEEEKQLYMPSDEELNKRVEAFIARVNKQRLLEATLVDHGRG